MNKKVGIIKDDRLLWHRISDRHKECPERLFHIYNNLQDWGLSEKLKTFSAIELTDEDIATIHSPFYLKQIYEYSSSHEKSYKYDKDTYLMCDTPYVAKLAAGGCRVLADAIMNDEIDKGFALIRPPGHHAETGRAMGFCIFNNIALTAQYLIDKYKLERILTIDFDVHHGNGTQEIFYNSSKVLNISIHQNNIFPFTGKGLETGDEEGKGYNINIPVHPNFGNAEYYYIFGKYIQNIADNYLPQIILVSAGFDGHIDDNISKIEITDEGYKTITALIMHIAQKTCRGKLLYILEGGYHIPSLCSGVKSALEMLVEEQSNPPGFLFAPRAEKVIKSEIPEEIQLKWGFNN